MAEKNLAEGFREVAEGHKQEVDIFHTGQTLAGWCEEHVALLGPFCEKYGKEATGQPDRLYHERFAEMRSGGLGFLRDMQDLYPMASACDIVWTMVGQAAQGARDAELLEVVNACDGQTAVHLKGLRTRMKQAAPQALLVGAQAPHLLPETRSTRRPTAVGDGSTAIPPPATGAASSRPVLRAFGGRSRGKRGPPRLASPVPPARAS